ncbi:hypothetical protein BELL_1240g00010 [Botrytis elliptica]|uniref:Uncharacterized protein n=1 Tax=Botrytis elliptica TaxID=278938 RepID=A0A4Z1IRY5_9HELO|nr:hypothetical protein BELL_1240g00010 [Botrytis elliptica]
MLTWLLQVLQEVAAAQHIVIMCGSITIAGSAFCVGLKSLELSYTDSPELQTLPSVVDIIERAGLRTKLKANLSERFSLEIRSLAELIDMFHTRQATDRRDKVFALLGMSSDDPEKAGLQPSYETSWEEIFQQVVKFILGQYIYVKNFRQRVVIQSKGVILGWVSSVERDDRQHVTIDGRRTVLGLDYALEWTVQASANPIRKRDIICLLYGASKPSIIRMCKDHFTVVVIAATPLNISTRYEWPQISQSTIKFLRYFSLVWNWESSCGNLKDEGEYETSVKIHGQTLVFPSADSRGYLNEAIRLWNDVEIMDDLCENSEADERLLKARSNYMAAFKKGPLLCPIGQGGRTLLSFAAHEGHDDTIKLLLEKLYPDTKDGKYYRTPLFCAALTGNEAIVKVLLTNCQVEVDSEDFTGQTPLSRAAEAGYEAIIKLLLATGRVEAGSKNNNNRTALYFAARNGHEAIVKVLLATGQVEADAKDILYQTALSMAARKGHAGVVKLLLATGQVEADSKDLRNQTPLLYAAKNGHVAVVKLLLATGQVEVDSRNRFGRTPLSWAAENGHEAVVKLLS